jgi:hypothetical protein
MFSESKPRVLGQVSWDLRLYDCPTWNEILGIGSEVVAMRKQAIIKVFLGSLLGGVGGVVSLVLAGIVLYRSDTFILDGPDVVGVESSWLSWTMLAVATIAALVIAGAVIAQLVAWIAAVLNTGGLPDKTWMIILLVTGILGFGFLGMVAYMVAGPDDEQHRPEQPADQQPPRTFSAVA